MPQPLIDGDVLVYEIASVSQYVDEQTGEIVPRPWDWVSDTVDARIEDICKAVGAPLKPIIYLTGDDHLHKMNARVRPSEAILKPNFRFEIAVTKGYKEGRASEKPYHYNNIRAYFIGAYDTRVSNGCEADDIICIEQYSRLKPEHFSSLEAADTIICTRDKDLRQCPGWHYGWECGKQPEFGPTAYTHFGTLDLVRGSSTTKLVGGGFKFFCAQLLTGDMVDNIPGLRGYGPVKVFALLRDCVTNGECLDVVRQGYRDVYPDSWKVQLREQANLIWMIRELNKDGSLKFFKESDWND